METRKNSPAGPLARRGFLALTAAFPVLAQERDWTNRQPVRYPDPDVIAVDKSFSRYVPFNSVIYRHYVGTRWAEGPAWSAEGQYLVWSDIPNNRQLRFLQEDSHVSTFREPSGYSNGNTFDFQGRQLSCEHAGRRVVRYENDGKVTPIATRYNGKSLNSPNDIVVDPDGGIWFTDPTYGIQGNYEGFVAQPELKDAVYRVDPSGRVDLVTDELDKPNGICFSRDYKKLYICDTGAPADIQVFDVDGAKLRNKKQFSNMMLGNGKRGLADGIRCDVDGNIWAGTSGGAGCDGVHVLSSAGQVLGRIQLPEVCANICFGGPKRNRLFMAASQSLYSLYVATSGAHIS